MDNFVLSDAACLNIGTLSHQKYLLIVGILSYQMVLN
jgi:hypothetical protein